MKQSRGPLLEGSSMAESGVKQGAPMSVHHGGRGPGHLSRSIGVVSSSGPTPSDYVGGKTTTLSSAGSASISITDLTGGTDSAPQDGDVIFVVITTSRGNFLPASGVTSQGYWQAVSVDQVDIYRTRVECWIKEAGASPDTTVSVTVPTNADAYANIAIHVWRNVTQISQRLTAGAGNNGEPNPPSITEAAGNLIIAGGGASDVAGSLSLLTSSDLDHFIADKLQIGTVGLGSLISAGSAFDPATFGGGSTSGNASWVAFSVGGTLDDGSLALTAATFETQTSGTVSSSAYATKGSIYTITAKMDFNGLDATITPSGSEDYKLVVAEVDLADTITSILGSSATATYSTTGLKTFTLTSPITLQIGQRIAIMLVRTDGTSVSPARVTFPASAALSNSHFSYYGSVRYASLDPAVSDAVLYDNLAVVRMLFAYDYFN